MTGYPDLNYPAFTRAANRLLDCGYEVSNPAQYDVVLGETWEDCLRRDLMDLLGCDGVATLNGHWNSRGAQFEVYVAKKLGMPVFRDSTWVRRALPSR
jgi:hypothetical protein